jgi:uncharacterized repeat protein (TIGR03803 family)
LINVNGTLYGVTSGGGSSSYGTVFSISTTGAHTVLYSFVGGGDGEYPSSGLINVKGMLYGTTSAGGGYECGGNGCGTVYSISTSGGESAIHYFGDGSDGWLPLGVINVKGMLYGTTFYDESASKDYGTVYSIKRSGGSTVFLYRFAGGNDGSYPNGLINVHGTLYGATEEGGSSECATASAAELFSA